MISLKKFGHNNLDQAFYAKKPNDLQKHISYFLNKCNKKILNKKYYLRPLKVK